MPARTHPDTIIGRSYAIGIVLAAIVFGGNGVLYKIEPASVSPDALREAVESPGVQQNLKPPTFGSSGGSVLPK
jgi:hypothetical protein